ncbi:MAG: dipeptide ABC transporter ATP-binding protein [Actinomycetota bacterium]
MRELTASPESSRARTDDVLAVAQLDVRFRAPGREAHALRGVDLRIGPGEVVALVGESGSGKSTLGLAIQGLLPQEGAPEVAGSIRLGGIEVVGAPSAAVRALRRTMVRSVFQDPMTSLNPTMRVGHQLAEACVDETRPEEWLERVGIPRARERMRAFPHQLSGGQRQRVMIAMAMAAGPELVVADEPTTALDVTVQAQILQLFRDLRGDRGTSFLFITHDLPVASAIADRIVVLYAGRVAETGPVLEVATHPAHPYTAALLESRFGLGADKSRQLPTPRGEIDAVPPEHGCAFAPRCLLAVESCREETPPLAPAGQHSGEVACFRSDAVTATVWKREAAAWPAGEGSTDARPVLELVGVRKSFTHRRFGGGSEQRVEALRGIDLEVADGESVAIVGESGSGKSTLLRIVAGLVRPDLGDVRLRDRERPQMIYQDAYASLTPWLTVRDLVEERLRHRGLSKGRRRERVAEALQQVGLNPALAGARPPQLSGGQRQRVAVARAIVVPPRLLLCDEPVSAIDVSLAAAMLNLLQSLRIRLGLAMLFVTHDLAAARFVSDRIVVMREGEIVEIGAADSVTASPRNEYTRELLAAIPAAPDR